MRSKLISSITFSNKQVNIFLLYFHRFLRLTPLLAMGILLVTTLLNHVGDGPLWPKYTATQDNCVEYWWSALLYVQNYVNPTQMVSLYFVFVLNISILNKF